METKTQEAEGWRLDIVNASFLTGIPILAAIGMVWYTMNHGVSSAELAIFGFMYIACGLSITAGYHRLFSHRTHKGAWPLRLFYALFGAGAFQNSAIKWCSDHRRHHLVTDSDDDPYTVLKGFFWAHIGWVMVSQDEAIVEKVEDLEADPILAFQDRHIFLLGFLVGMVLPGAAGWYLIGGMTGFLGGFIWGGLFRVVIVHHATFLINSAAHTWGTQPYSTANTSRDSPLLSLFTYGEGYHNFHHTFQADYRNGHKWHHWDPTKWWIRGFSFIKMTSDLHKIPDKTIESRKMKTAYETSHKLEDTELKENAQSFVDRLRKGYTELDAHRKALKTAKKNKDGVSSQNRKTVCIDLKKEIKQTKEAIAQIRDEFQQWMNGLPAMA
ncbi:fatty acid desaturase [Candidatus Poseidoniales archaeon]|nr:fatty acid desaturase [Candidatus Poseidoniales archaeon]MDA8818245.1 fatty acid desaturase [Candidatus Poseidoniales archaeon]MDA8838041.1 fatty acid desaturase [Candidatus Poseidoniales archaeon]MDB2624527.1 fatty acid desaturase [Candidatus Poseidoniales archaeon]